MNLFISEDVKDTRGVYFMMEKEILNAFFLIRVVAIICAFRHAGALKRFRVSPNDIGFAFWFY